jgi:formate dehydrogenase maturation protein FdhE
MRGKRHARIPVAQPLLDRRSAVRLIPPPCPECGSEAPVAVFSRTDYVLYLRCAACGHVWNMLKPEVRPLGS